MAPRNTQHGASATSRRASGSGERARASAHSRAPKTSLKKHSAKAATCDAPSSTRWWAVPLAVIVIVTAFVLAYYPVAQVQYREARERARLSSELEALTARNERLSGQVARLQTPEGVEDYARTQLGLVKRGERVVVVRDASGVPLVPAEPGVPDVDSGNIAKQPVGPWTDLLDLVFGLR
ncbi:MAG: septum formation initiator family protein [Coriobacteriia bacterium]|nr:septum formation initiator family protein [Coriobacteriia bacterium]